MESTEASNEASTRPRSCEAVVSAASRAPASFVRTLSKVGACPTNGRRIGLLAPAGIPRICVRSRGSSVQHGYIGRLGLRSISRRRLRTSDQTNAAHRQQVCSAQPNASAGHPWSVVVCSVGHCNVPALVLACLNHNLDHAASLSSNRCAPALPTAGSSYQLDKRTARISSALQGAPSRDSFPQSTRAEARVALTYTKGGRNAESGVRTAERARGRYRSSATTTAAATTRAKPPSKPIQMRYGGPRQSLHFYVLLRLPLAWPRLLGGTSRVAPLTAQHESTFSASPARDRAAVQNPSRVARLRPAAASGDRPGWG